MDTVDMENGVRSNERITLSREVKQGAAGPADGRMPPIRTPTQGDPGSRAHRLGQSVVRIIHPSAISPSSVVHCLRTVRPLVGGLVIRGDKPKEENNRECELTVRRWNLRENWAVAGLCCSQMLEFVEEINSGGSFQGAVSWGLSRDKEEDGFG